MVVDQLSKWVRGTASTTIGMKLWLDPQISEHWPKNKPGWDVINVVWFSRPGTASVLIPRAGTAHECRTSSAEINIRIGDSIGMTMWWSVSKRRNAPGGSS